MSSPVVYGGGLFQRVPESPRRKEAGGEGKALRLPRGQGRRTAANDLADGMLMGIRI